MEIRFHDTSFLNEIHFSLIPLIYIKNIRRGMNICSLLRSLFLFTLSKTRKFKWNDFSVIEDEVKSKKFDGRFNSNWTFNKTVIFVDFKGIFNSKFQWKLDYFNAKFQWKLDQNEFLCEVPIDREQYNRPIKFEFGKIKR